MDLWVPGSLVLPLCLSVTDCAIRRWPPQWYPGWIPDKLERSREDYGMVEETGNATPDVCGEFLLGGVATAI